ncbi:MAG TPA: hypothetical protein ENN84_09255 [Candidatus Marinimicrobia bacterium]|nr:hypothetical protein [Candidatus Neomarinimicrobiota bacterium]
MWSDITINELYERSYQQTFQYLEKRRQKDHSFGIKELQSYLSSLYNKQAVAGLDKTGPTEIAELATIAAFEAFLVKWQKELENLSSN